MEKNCKQCKQVFSKPYKWSSKQWGQSVFCSRRCMGLSRHDIPLTEATKIKISNAKIKLPLEESKRRKQARNIMYRALQEGKLTRSSCAYRVHGCKGQIEGHHHDYSRPLDIKWLCRSHHLKYHRGLVS